MKLIKRLLWEEEGVTLIEYALMAILIAVALVSTLRLVGVEVGSLYKLVSDSVVEVAPNG